MIPQISVNALMPGVVPTGAPPIPGTNPLSRPANTGNAGSALTDVAFDTAGGGIGGAVQDTISMISLLLQQILGGGNPAGGGAPAPSFDKGGATRNTGSTGGSADLSNTTNDPEQSARLDDVLAKVAQDPEGAKLLEEAQKKGYTIEVGDPAAAIGGADAGQQINGVAMTGSEKKIIISPDAPDFEKTVVHELVHAATDEDGNSQQEEGIADVIGYRVANRITGKAQPGDTQSIYENKMVHYRDLEQRNDVRNSLASLGIDAGI